MQLCETRLWQPVVTRTAHLLCDARSTPPRVAAVLVIDGAKFYADEAPPQETISFLQPRGDGQITSLEILAIAFGLSTFIDMIRGRNVHVHSDNTGAQHTTAAGRARVFDHTMLIHSIWTLALEASISLYVSRVPTKENIADDPSRERYWLLDQMGAQAVEPKLDARFRHPDAWESVRISS